PIHVREINRLGPVAEIAPGARDVAAGAARIEICHGHHLGPIGQLAVAAPVRLPHEPETDDANANHAAPQCAATFSGWLASPGPFSPRGLEQTESFLRSRCDRSRWLAVPASSRPRADRLPSSRRTRRGCRPRV